jgi:hypothetical protein
VESITTEAFWIGFEKRASAGSAAAGFIKKMAPKAEAAIAKTAPTLDYAAMRAQELTKKRTPAGTLSYHGGSPVYHGPGKTPAESRLAADTKLKEQAKKRLAYADKGGYTDPQFRRAM